MAVKEYGSRGIRWRLGGAQWGPFDGGLNLRDSYLDVAPNELINGTNLTLDERGEIYKRNHCPASASFPNPPAGTVSSSFYSTAIALGIIQVGTTIYKCALGGGSWTSFRTTGSSAPAQFVDFGGKMVYVHPVDGVRIYDGTTDSLGDASIIGTCIATWQNKVFVAGFIAVGSTPRIYWSAAGNAASWTTATDFVDVREKDDKPIKALFPASGLLAFKEDSTYRLNDSTTGAYTTIDWANGTVSPNSVTSSDGQIIFWGIDGLYATNGISPAVNVGDKVRPVFTSSTINATTKPLISAETLNNRVYFAFPGVSSTVCDTILEYNPRVGWVMEQDLGGSSIGPLFGYLNSTGIRTVSFTLGSAAIKDAFTSTTITSFSFGFQTGWSQPFGPGALSVLTRLSVIGLFAATTYPISVNYMSESGTTGINSPQWTGTLSSAVGFQPADFQPMIRGRAFQLAITDNSSANFRLFSIQISNLLTAVR